MLFYSLLLIYLYQEFAGAHGGLDKPKVNFVNKTRLLSVRMLHHEVNERLKFDELQDEMTSESQINMNKYYEVLFCCLFESLFC